MSVLSRIGELTPVNKTAAMVTGASEDSGVAEDSRSEKHRNLIRLLKQCDRSITATDDPQKKKTLGQHRQKIQNAIKEEKKNSPKRSTNATLFMDSAKDLLPRAMFEIIHREAIRRFMKQDERLESEKP